MNNYRTTFYNPTYSILFILLLQILLPRLNAQVPFTFQEGSLLANIGSGNEFITNAKYVELDVQDKQPGFFISFEQLQWKERFEEKEAEFFINTNWIKVDGAEQIVAISPNQFKLNENGYREIYFEVLNNGWIALTIEVQVHFNKNKKTIKKKAYRIERIIKISGKKKDGLQEISEVQIPELDQQKSTDSIKINAKKVTLLSPKTSRLPIKTIDTVYSLSPSMFICTTPIKTACEPINKESKVKLDKVKPMVKKVTKKSVVESNENLYRSNKIEIDTNLKATINFDNGVSGTNIESGKPPFLVTVLDEQNVSVYSYSFNETGNYNINLEELNLPNGNYNVLVKDARKTNAIKGTFVLNNTKIGATSLTPYSPNFLLTTLLTFILFFIISFLHLRISVLFPAT